jgi:hypothetical protein
MNQGNYSTQQSMAMTTERVPMDYRAGQQARVKRTHAGGCAVLPFQIQLLLEGNRFVRSTAKPMTYW